MGSHQQGYCTFNFQKLIVVTLAVCVKSSIYYYRFERISISGDSFNILYFGTFLVIEISSLK
jgi:hypothetical protein